MQEKDVQHPIHDAAIDERDKEETMFVHRGKSTYRVCAGYGKGLLPGTAIYTAKD